jgi:hypothetical protein
MPLTFLYSYNTPILLTNKIIVKKLNNFLKIQKNNGLVNTKKKKKKRFFGINHFFLTISLIFYLIKE